MTLDNIVAKCQQLSNDDLNIVVEELQKEQKSRKDKEQQAAWDNVFEVIKHYVNTYGDIVISDYYGCCSDLQLTKPSGFVSERMGVIDVL